MKSEQKAILSELEDISYRKMFGEYMFYYKGKIFGSIYDNRFLIKVTEAGKKLMPDYKRSTHMTEAN